MKKELYVVEMLRWGDRENHSYVLGVYDTKTKAENAGKFEENYRGGKYGFYVNTVILNHVDQDAVDYYKRCTVG